jgi:hypothetical protein
MKKWGRRLLVLLILAVLGYGSWFVFLRPLGYTDRIELTERFFASPGEAGICEETFQAETVSLCETFGAGLADLDYTIASTREIGSTVTITLTSTTGDVTFTVTFVETPTTGARRYLNPVYYQIDTIE